MTARERDPMTGWVSSMKAMAARVTADFENRYGYPPGEKAGTDDQVSLLIEALEEYWDDEVAFDSGVLWDAVHRCLCDGVADDADPLRLVVVGGAPQDHAPDGRLVALVASEHVPLVAAALAAVDPAWLCGRHGNLGLPEDFAEVRAIVEGIARFYQAAAGSGCAVVFATPSARA